MFSSSPIECAHSATEGNFTLLTSQSNNIVNELLSTAKLHINTEC